MEREEAFTFLAHGTRTGKLATVRPDGRPHVASVWFVVDGEDLVFMTMESSVKGRNLLASGRAALTADLEVPPYAFVTVEGPVTITREDPNLLAWATEIGRRYMGDDRAEEFGRRNSVPEELLVRLHAERVVGRDDVVGYG